MKDCENCPFYYRDTFTEEQEEGCDIVNGTYGDKAKSFILRSTKNDECWCPLWLVYSLQLDIAGISLVTNEDTPLIVKAFTKVYKDIDILKEKFIKECPQFIESKHEVKTFGMKE